MLEEKIFNKALRIVMAEFQIPGNKIAELAGLSENSISGARRGTSIRGDNIVKISNALATVDPRACRRFWEIVTPRQIGQNKEMELASAG